MAHKICQMGLKMPAMLLLDAGRPLAVVFGQLLWMIQPTVNLLSPQNNIGQLATFFEKPHSFSALMAQLEKEME